VIHRGHDRVVVCGKTELDGVIWGVFGKDLFPLYVKKADPDMVRGW